MAEYIEREAAIRVVNGQSSLTMTRSSLIDSISELPAADVAPVVHGRWIEGVVIQTDIATLYDYTCPLCGIVSDRNSNECPNCGAKMDGGDSDEADRCRHR